MSALPHDLTALGPVDDYLRDIPPEALWPAVGRLVLAEPTSAPDWARARALGAWRAINSASWGRYLAGVPEEQRRGLIAETYVWASDGRWYRFSGVSVGPEKYPTRNEAMEAEDARARQRGWLHDDVRPPEDAPAPEPEGERAAKRQAVRDRILTPITDEEYLRRRAAREALTDEELRQVADSLATPQAPHCRRCRGSGRVSRGSLWGPFEDCPECRRAP